jgi:hypothetical protein
MDASPKRQLPQHAILAASFAENLAREYTIQGGSLQDLFVAFAGLVSARDKIVGSDRLAALDQKISGNASAEGS